MMPCTASPPQQRTDTEAKARAKAEAEKAEAEKESKATEKEQKTKKIREQKLAAEEAKRRAKEEKAAARARAKEEKAALKASKAEARAREKEMQRAAEQARAKAKADKAAAKAEAKAQKEAERIAIEAEEEEQVEEVAALEDEASVFVEFAQAVPDGGLPLARRDEVQHVHDQAPVGLTRGRKLLAATIVPGAHHQIARRREIRLFNYRRIHSQGRSLPQQVVGEAIERLIAAVAGIIVVSAKQRDAKIGHVHCGRP